MADKKTKVLIVEDDPMILDMYVHKFEQEGFTVVSHDRGDGAVELAEKEQPEIVLLDVIMPGLDGFSVLSMMRENENTKNLKVVMLTNLGQDEDKEKGVTLGALGYIVKSSKTPGEVVKEVRNYLAKN
ncbi:response regulator [Candidatus Uhrbacteria bacterium CG10_big_fil_rev_8_21_14_0_10_48_11]|uniref:Response regulator n=1 Tax=Candidatus Uhrbacteria bacterium CG10_big_fil_rev_8_21_14_0_10_48_11 TaxID=1975037 RepID=A0A2M8LF25_9BACT|nr:MAG: response regulator [Candidatus Uhrbacteria bacterium CG10_big_fil_rev_8_21_14_0_10_48_11]